jgi:hypothetical protein
MQDNVWFQHGKSLKMAPLKFSDMTGLENFSEISVPFDLGLD